jgi:hypothetical protein
MHVGWAQVIIHPIEASIFAGKLQAALAIKTYTQSIIFFFADNAII